MTTEPGTPSYRFLDLSPLEPDRETFAPYGQLITAEADGTPFGPDDAALDFSQGTPRFYIMRLPHRGLVATQITRHRRVTQCLATAGTEPWFIALAPPSSLDDLSAEPDLEDIKAFRIAPGIAIKLHAGTWHAGPFFAGESMDFFNLELADTNETDHQNSLFAKRSGTAIRLAV